MKFGKSHVPVVHHHTPVNQSETIYYTILRDLGDRDNRGRNMPVAQQCSSDGSGDFNALAVMFITQNVDRVTQLPN